MKYKIVGDYVVYGGPQNYKREITFLSNASLIDCLKFIIEKCDVKSPDLDTIYNENVDQCLTLGSYHRYEIKKDYSINTLWNDLSKKEKSDLFDYAKNWMENEMVSIPDLLRKIEFFEDERGE